MVARPSLVLGVLLSVVSGALAALLSTPPSTPELLSTLPSIHCKCFPGDSCWPTKQERDAFNVSLGGKLIATVPLPSMCHLNNAFTTYDPGACEELRSVWSYPSTHTRDSASPMAPWVGNFSCELFLDAHTPYQIGPLVRYSVKATSVRDYQQTIQFTKQNNIRLVIRNTGHDYLGKSSGVGAVALWTHHMKDIEFSDYTSPHYRGRAIKVGPGLQGIEAMAAAHAQSNVLVAGNCETVGVAGGYSQGGGHGQLASWLGLAADQVLAWDVVTAADELITATPTQNPDLYWALSGGGGGTYGVVISMTSKVCPELRTATANLTFSIDPQFPPRFWEVVPIFVAGIQPLTDIGGVAIWELTNRTFVVSPVTVPGGTQALLQTWLQPTLDLVVRYQMSFNYHP